MIDAGAEIKTPQIDADIGGSDMKPSRSDTTGRRSSLMPDPRLFA